MASIPSSSSDRYATLPLSLPIITTLMRFCKLLENYPTHAVGYYGGIVKLFRDSENICFVEDCAEILAEYIKKSSIWKRRILTEKIQKIDFPGKLFVLRHFMDFQTPGISIDNMMALHDNLRVFQKLKVPGSGYVLGENGYGKFGIGPGVVKCVELKEIEFQFDKAFHGKNHTIFWRKFSGEFWAAGKSANFLKCPENYQENYHSYPVKLDYLCLKRENPIIEIAENYTLFHNFSIERSLFIGNLTARKMFKSRHQNLCLTEIEEGKNWMTFARLRVEGKKHHVALEHEKTVFDVIICLPQCTWKCKSLNKSKEKIIFFFCGKRVPRLTDLAVCDDGSIWYHDLDTLYQGSFSLCSSSQEEPLQLVASLNEVPFLYRLGGFSIAPDAKSAVFFGKRTDHFEQLMPRHQLDYSKFMSLTFDPWHCYFGTLLGAIQKLDQVQKFLENRYDLMYNEYGFICDELETLTAIDHCYQLIKAPDMMQELLELENPDDKLAQMITVKVFMNRAKENEQLRVLPDEFPRVNENRKTMIERVASKAKAQVEHKIFEIQKGLRKIILFNLPPYHEGVWTYLKFVEFIGHFQNRRLGGKGKFEIKQPLTPYFQTRDVGRIIERRQLTINMDDKDDKLDIVRIIAAGHRSDKSQMDHFYIYPMDFYVLRRFIEVLNPELLEHIDQNGVIDLNQICDKDPDNYRFITSIREISGCDHPQDFRHYKRRFNNFNFSFETRKTLQCSNGFIFEAPELLIRIFCSSNLSDFPTVLNFPKKLVKLAFEALLDMRELCHVDFQTKFEICQFYTQFQMLEAAADVIKLMVVTGSENDAPIFCRLFELHPMEMIVNVAKYRLEILFHWGQLPFSGPPIPILEKIFAIIARKRYNQTSTKKPLIIWNELPIAIPKMSQKWLREKFTNIKEDTEKDVEKWIQKFLFESCSSL